MYRRSDDPSRRKNDDKGVSRQQYLDYLNDSIVGTHCDSLTKLLASVRGLGRQSDKCVPIGTTFEGPNTGTSSGYRKYCPSCPEAPSAPESTYRPKRDSGPL
ncbi:uncharacterized protein RCO7_14419 [Rhynchosporium graminicola]|uniref:Uncharacterized protein n=1 Tax=Rhynchosporium graminicola TaxID=2792576 RepID=A0A1E1KIL0_9HELO|nr:uncharacterized protein RCO7_14419 [Rhynchosporium commune]